MIRVYIASAYSIGNQEENVRKQIDAADSLITLRFCPYAPLLMHFQHMVHPRPYEDWMQQDIEWVKTCDCILRLPGESKGADEEVKLAQSLQHPVFHEIGELNIYYNFLPQGLNIPIPR